MMFTSRCQEPSISKLCHFFQQAHARSTRIWTDAYQWATANHEVLQRDNLYFAASSSVKTVLSEKVISKFLKNEGKWKTFEEFYAHSLSIWTVCVNYEDVYETTYTCPVFYKKNVC